MNVGFFFLLLFRGQTGPLDEVGEMGWQGSVQEGRLILHLL